MMPLLTFRMLPPSPLLRLLPPAYVIDLGAVDNQSRLACVPLKDTDILQPPWVPLEGRCSENARCRAVGEKRGKANKMHPGPGGGIGQHAKEGVKRT